MEAAVIDWKNIDSRFVRDELFEGISAPKWVDFFAADDESIADDAWFCKPSCDHPKTAEDFRRKKAPSPNSHLLNPSPVDRNKRDPALKKRIKGLKCESEAESDENRNPNFSSSSPRAAKPFTEKKTSVDDNIMGMRKPKLRSTMSARNLFSGGDFLNKIAEFCTELKRLATRTKDGGEKEKETKPFLQQPQRRNKKRQVDENSTPIRINGDENPMQIRTCPPTPQCFSSHGKGVPKPPSKAARSPIFEKGILQERVEKHDVLCLLKPCTLSS